MKSIQIRDMTGVTLTYDKVVSFTWSQGYIFTFSLECGETVYVNLRRAITLAIKEMQ